ncbi:flowering time control protein FCA-like isoform X2 [Coffea arabica]|uniref:Flowering time control protein FCA-like isoform X2 n=1 Tax=Coffea arabica TaxID=13443 RepID=A0ABM4X865_COFAR
MERHRGGRGRGRGEDRYGRSPDSHHHFNSTRYSRGPPYSSRPSSYSSDNHNRQYSHHHRRSPDDDSTNNYRGGGGGARDYHRAFDSPPRYHSPSRSASSGSAGGDRGRGAGGGGFNYNYPMPSLAGQKRGYSYSDSRGSPPDRFDGGSFAKLFVGSVPRTATEEDIRPLFEVHGRLLEVALIRDKRTGQQQGCCFIKYSTSEEADRAIRALHNQYTLPGGVGPIQVRYADGERERLGAVEFKLFVGSLNKQATEREVEEIFTPYGHVEDVYLMRDDMRQSRGCGFVKYSHRDMALAAINALNGIYTMRGCDQPLTVRFADPKKPRLGESRGGAAAYGGPGFTPCFPTPGIRPPTNLGEPLNERIPSNAWQPMSPQNLGPPPNAGMHGFGNHLLPRPGDIAATSAPGSIPSSVSGNADRLLPGFAVSSTSMSQSNYNQSLPQAPSVGPQISPLQKPLQSPQYLPPSLLLQPSNAASFVQSQTYHASVRPFSQALMPHPTGHTPLNQALPSDQLTGFGGPLSVSQPQVPLNASSAIGQASRTSNSQQNVMSALANQQQLPAPAQSLQPPNQSPSQLAQMLQQQTQNLQASFQSSQQAFSQLQQQMQMMQPSNPGLQSSKQQFLVMQALWAGTAPQKVVNNSDQLGGDVAAAESANPTVPATSRAIAAGKCNWTEHISPEGYKYYYNSTTGESKWEKPEELTLYEQQQQQKLPVQQPQVQPHPQNLSVQNFPQRQFQVQNQIQTQQQSQIHPQQVQQSSQSFPYQVPGVTDHQNVQLGYMQVLPATVSKSMDDPAHFQQRHQPAQDWMWKSKPAGP